MTDEEILDKYIDLSNSDLTSDEKETLMNMIKEHKQAFSLRDEIGQYPNIKIDIDVIDDSPFFVRPFPIHEEDNAYNGQVYGKISLPRNFDQEQHHPYFPSNASS